jgi:thiol-disulfide isomerase/thioredoxin
MLGLSFPLWPLLILTATLVMALINEGLNRRGRPAAELRIIDPMIYRGLLALVCARVMFVILHKGSYGGLWQMLEIRDRGLHLPTLLIVFAVLMGHWLVRSRVTSTRGSRPSEHKNPEHKKPEHKKPEHKNRLITRASLLLGVGSVWCLAGWGVYQVTHNTPAQWPDHRFETLAGESVSLPESFAAKQETAREFTVVNLWATWCSVCRAEMPALEQAQDEFPNANIVLINQGEDRASVADYLRSSGLEFSHVWLDPDARMGTWLGQQALPMTLVFDHQGQLIAGHSGLISVAVLGELMK